MIRTINQLDEQAACEHKNIFPTSSDIKVVDGARKFIVTWVCLDCSSEFTTEVPGNRN